MRPWIRRLPWVTVGAVPFLLVAGYIGWELKDQRDAREELVALYATLGAATSPSELRTRVSKSRHLFLNNEAKPTHVMTPLAWDARNWNIRLEYVGDQLCRVGIGIYDDGSPPKDGPPDRAFACHK